MRRRDDRLEERICVCGCGETFMCHPNSNRIFFSKSHQTADTHQCPGGRRWNRLYDYGKVVECFIAEPEPAIGDVYLPVVYD